jgi:hypothetical protein
VDGAGGRDGTFSTEFLGVDLLSMELLGRLLADEFVEAKDLRFMITLCGLDFVFTNVEPDFAGGTMSVSAVLLLRNLSNLGLSTMERRAGDILPIDFEPARGPSSSIPSPTIRFGEGDLEEVIHDFRAKVANDSDTVLVLFSFSRVALEIVGTGGASDNVVFVGSGMFCRSGEPLTLCIQDLGRATKDFLLPNLSSFGLSSTLSLPNVMPAFGSFFFNV